jgi:hypothetical protein
LGAELIGNTDISVYDGSWPEYVSFTTAYLLIQSTGQEMNL